MQTLSAVYLLFLGWALCWFGRVSCHQGLEAEAIAVGAREVLVASDGGFEACQRLVVLAFSNVHEPEIVVGLEQKHSLVRPNNKVESKLHVPSQSSAPRPSSFGRPMQPDQVALIIVPAW